MPVLTKIQRHIPVLAALIVVMGAPCAMAETVVERGYRDPLGSVMTFTKEELNEFSEQHSKDYKKVINENTNSERAARDFRTEIVQDTTDENDPRYDLYANGKILDEARKLYLGAGAMISPCHMLTAYHVVDREYAPQKKIKDGVVKFKFFKDPKSGYYSKIASGKLVAGSSAEMNDYAIIRIDKVEALVETGLKRMPYLTPIYTNTTTIDQYPSLSTGGSASHYRTEKPAALYGMMGKARSDNEYIYGDFNASSGDSGGNIVTYFANERKFKLSGLRIKGGANYNHEPLINGENITVAMPLITIDVARNYPGLMAEIVQAGKRGSCNSPTLESVSSR